MTTDSNLARNDVPSAARLPHWLLTALTLFGSWLVFIPLGVAFNGPVEIVPRLEGGRYRGITWPPPPTPPRLIPEDWGGLLCVAGGLLVVCFMSLALAGLYAHASPDTRAMSPGARELLVDGLGCLSAIAAFFALSLLLSWQTMPLTPWVLGGCTLAFTAMRFVSFARR